MQRNMDRGAMDEAVLSDKKRKIQEAPVEQDDDVSNIFAATKGGMQHAAQPPPPKKSRWAMYTDEVCTVLHNAHS